MGPSIQTRVPILSASVVFGTRDIDLGPPNYFQDGDRCIGFLARDEIVVAKCKISIAFEQRATPKELCKNGGRRISSCPQERSYEPAKPRTYNPQELQAINNSRKGAEGDSCCPCKANSGWARTFYQPGKSLVSNEIDNSADPATNSSASISGSRV
ncbi:hypothetical protein K0M31_014776 [Melipona bicolor]|uniref:Uncharacterized protein n=1 Tax=Melipona bicolor TaxID=60889 RepID=A0AA40FGV3_9HYME|nr:hypothetical protein K0M31_014776 [Melipona bicolor]